MLTLKINLIDPEAHTTYGAPEEVWLQYVYNPPTVERGPSKCMVTIRGSIIVTISNNICSLCDKFETASIFVQLKLYDVQIPC